MKLDINGKTALVTGSSKGIGKAIAKGLAQRGAQVVISSRSQEACDAVANEFTKEGLKAVGIECHIGKEDQRINLVDKTIHAFGRTRQYLLRTRSTPRASSWPCRTGNALPREVGRFETNC